MTLKLKLSVCNDVECDQQIHLGFLAESEKWDAMAGCDGLLMPPPYEGLSMALLEAWRAGRPVLVNGRCDVLTDHCPRSNGGVWYSNYAEFAVILNQTSAGTRSYVLSSYS